MKEHKYTFSFQEKPKVRARLELLRFLSRDEKPCLEWTNQFGGFEPDLQDGPLAEGQHGRVARLLVVLDNPLLASLSL